MSATARLEREIEFRVARMFEAMQEHRERYPEADYSCRIYWCGACRSIDHAVAPRDELPDDYACPACGRPQVPRTPCAP